MAFIYKGLKDRLEVHVVTDEEIEHQMQMLRQQHPKIRVVEDRPAQMGDEVILDYAGFCDGEQFDGGTAQNQSLELGSGRFIPGFEEQLAGKKTGEEVSVQVTFPEEYHAPELAGKAAEFRCVIHEIREKSHYELDDTFAREVGNCEDLEDMKTKMRRGMEDYCANRAEMELQDRLLRKAAETLDEDVSEENLQAAVEEQMQMLRAQLAQQGADIQMYCQFMNTTEEALREQAIPAAKKNVKAQMAVDKIVELEGLKAEPEEIDQACQIVAQQNGMTVEQMAQYRDEAFEQAMARSVLVSKAMHLIRDVAEVTED